MECVTKEFCWQSKRIPFRGECRQVCPAGFTEDSPNRTNNSTKTNRMCYPCVDGCLKECDSIEIDTLALSEIFRGCQIVKSHVYVRIESGVANTMEILEQNMGDIEEIRGHLKIYRSPAITSLSFFRKLHTIHATGTLESDKYSIILISNENLQSIWDWREKPNFQLGRGNLLVQYNSKLCLDEIHVMQKRLGTNTSLDLISTESNGYEETCTAIRISASAEAVSFSNVTITWEQFVIPPTQKLMGYMIYYIEAPQRNITHMGVDSCTA